MKRPLTLLVLLCLIHFNGQSQKTTINTEKLDEHFLKALPADEPGGAILIMKGDNILFSKGYGLADIKTNEKINTNTVFNTGSISKTFVSNAILRLEEEGKLTLEDPLNKYFNDFTNKKISKKVKIKHLLNHSSGLMDNRQTTKESKFYLTAKDVENWYPITQATSLVFEPGAKFQYSNPAYNGLALIIEQVSGMKWQKYVKEQVFDPAGMKTSTITDGPHPKKGVAHGYVKNGGSWKESDYGEVPTFAAAGNGGIWSSVNELAKYQLALVNEKIISKKKFNESRMVKTWPNWNSDTSPHIGWSWFISQTSNGLKTVGHTGSQGGFRANFVTIPEKKITFIILCNTPRDIMGFSQLIMEWLWENDMLN